MRRTRRAACLLLGGVLIIGSTGCQAGGSGSRRVVSKPEPGLTMEGDPAAPGTAAGRAPPRATPAFVERHPLLYKPKEYYDTSGNNTAVKVAGATLVGIPVGIFGELRQIVRGQPAPPRGY